MDGPSKDKISFKDDQELRLFIYFSFRKFIRLKWIIEKMLYTQSSMDPDDIDYIWEVLYQDFRKAEKLREN